MLSIPKGTNEPGVHVCVRVQGREKRKEPRPYKSCHMLAVNIDELMEK